MEFLLGFPFSVLATIVAILIGWKLLSGLMRVVSNPPPAVPGLPLIGNLHQLKAKKPHQTFAQWAEVYGPVYSIKMGSSAMVVINSTEIAKEAMVTKFSSISTRKLSKALNLPTSQKSILAMSDYGEYHKMSKRYILASLLGATAQKRNRGNRDTMVENVISSLLSEITNNPQDAVKLRDLFKAELFRLALKQFVEVILGLKCDREMTGAVQKIMYPEDLLLV